MKYYSANKNLLKECSSVFNNVSAKRKELNSQAKKYIIDKEIGLEKVEKISCEVDTIIGKYYNYKLRNT